MLILWRTIKEILGFYANEKNYEATWDDESQQVEQSAILADKGKQARELLKGINDVIIEPEEEGRL